MKKTAAVLLVLLVAAWIPAGCGGGSAGGDALSLLKEATEAMKGTAGYRMKGDIEIGMGAASSPMSIAITADVQNAPDGMRQHMFVEMGGFEAEAYIIGDTYYQYAPGQGWQKMNLGLYRAQNMNMGLVDADQMEIMAELAEDSRVEEEKEGRALVSFRLGKGFFDASLATYREYIEKSGQDMQEEWLRMAEESVTDFNADIKVWINTASGLAERMEIAYTMAGIPQVGEMKSSMRVDLYDYDRDIEIELPPEAAGAEELKLPS